VVVGAVALHHNSPRRKRRVGPFLGSGKAVGKGQPWQALGKRSPHPAPIGKGKRLTDRRERRHSADGVLFGKPPGDERVDEARREGLRRGGALEGELGGDPRLERLA
jgi:hypothetical protein